MLYCDTRQKKGKHFNIEGFFDEHGVEYAIKKLDYGDYINPGKPDLAIDTKQNLDELAANICSKDHARFRREIDRAAADGARLLVLTEEHPEYNDRLALMGAWRCYKCVKCGGCDPRIATTCWKNPSGRRPANGLQVMRTINTMSTRHPVEFMFCSRADTARIICDLLEIPIRKTLEVNTE